MISRVKDAVISCVGLAIAVAISGGVFIGTLLAIGLAFGIPIAAAGAVIWVTGKTIGAW